MLDCNGLAQYICESSGTYMVRLRGMNMNYVHWSHPEKRKTLRIPKHFPMEGFEPVWQGRLGLENSNFWGVRVLRVMTLGQKSCASWDNTPAMLDHSSLTWIYNATFWCIYQVAPPPLNHKDLNKVCFATKWVLITSYSKGPFLEGASVFGDHRFSLKPSNCHGADGACAT